MLVMWPCRGAVQHVLLLCVYIVLALQPTLVLSTQLLFRHTGDKRHDRGERSNTSSAQWQDKADNFVAAWLASATSEGAERSQQNSHRSLGAELGEIVTNGASKMTMAEAIRAAELPDAVLSALRASSVAKGASAALPDGLTPSSGIKDEASAKEAVEKLNAMFRHTEDRIDAKTIECAAFTDRNRAEHAQVQSQLAQLDAEIGDLARTKSKAMAKISDAQQKLRGLLEQQEQKKRHYAKQLSSDQALLKERRDDVEVSEGMLGLTACEPYETFMQRPRNLTASLATQMVKICNSTSQGDLHPEVVFQDVRLQNSTSRLSATGREQLDKEIVKMHLLTDSAEDSLHLEAAGPDSPAEKSSFRCRMRKPHCARLHDTFVGLWASMRDQADALQEKITKFNSLHEKSRMEESMEMQSLTASIAAEQAALAEASASLSAEAERQMQKQQRLKQLQSEFNEQTKECKETLQLLMYSTLCGIRKVRNEIVEMQLPALAESGGPVDCVVGDWVATPCSVPCSFGGHGGLQNFTREVIRQTSNMGVECPMLRYQKPCNEFECPVDCVLTEWSTWSQCTKECGGGVQTRTRATAQQPENGGMACNVAQETQPCNTGSCDADCILSEWSEWTQCSKACDSGFIERSKEVKVEPQGGGSCFSEDDAQRYEKQSCNEHACYGDEVCHENMEVVVAVDSSGSMDEDGFKVLKSFVAGLLKRMASEAYGQKAVQVSVIQFGNGYLLPGKVVSDAKLIAPLQDAASLVPKVEALEWSAGFTNLAQALLKATDVLQRSETSDVRQTVVVVTDGAPSFVRQTQPIVEKLRQFARLAFVQVQSNPDLSDVELFKRFASRPWQTNYVNIPDHEQLEQKLPEMVTRVIAEICPHSESPARQAELAAEAGYRLEFKEKNCADGSSIFGKDRVATIKDCYTIARSAASGGQTVANFAVEQSDGSDLKDCIVWSSCPETTNNGTYNLYVPIAAGVAGVSF
mmetsp:Transcript_46538/g.110678  ORF Transcript_46538/g.110678 Transcript_46538/m.110678 type:complete len:978 (-) Transcript_46538:30-2963(-)